DALLVAEVGDDLAGELRQGRARPLLLVADDDDERLEAGAERVTGAAGEEGLALDRQQELVLPHPARGAGGEEDAGDRSATSRGRARLSRHGWPRCAPRGGAVSGRKGRRAARRRC